MQKAENDAWISFPYHLKSIYCVGKTGGFDVIKDLGHDTTIHMVRAPWLRARILVVAYQRTMPIVRLNRIGRS